MKSDIKLLFFFWLQAKAENIPHEIIRLKADPSVSEDIKLFLQIEQSSL